MGRKQRRDSLETVAREGTIAFTKLESCGAEIDGAIDLLCRYQNVVGAHILASAAEDIINATTKNSPETMPPNFVDHAIDELPEEHRSLVRGAYSYHYNYFKHGPNDLDKVAHIDPEMTVFKVYIVSFMFWLVGGKRSIRQFMYVFWFSCRYPDHIHPEFHELVAKDQRDTGRTGAPITEGLAEAKKLLEETVDNEEFAAKCDLSANVSDVHD